MPHQIKCTITGRVQGVMYRDFAKRKATKLGLLGFVENLSDGSVRVVAQGERPILEEYINCLKVGPIFSRVDNIEVAWLQGLDKFDDFQIRYKNFADRF